MSSGHQITFAQRFWHNFKTNMGANDSPAEVRQKATFGIVGGIAMLVIGIGCTGSAWSDYRTLGSSPVEMTAEQAVPSMEGVTEDARWVTMTIQLVFDCDNALEHLRNGAVVDRRFFASDSAKERFFYVNLKADVECRTVPQPMRGILKKADAGLTGWAKGKGMDIPESKYPYMEFVVGAGPDTQRILVYTGLALLFFGVVVTAACIRKRRDAVGTLATTRAI